jgi:glucokinase
VGADLGGTYLKLGALAPDGTIVHTDRVPTHRSGDRARFLDWLCDAIRSFCDELDDPVLGLGLGSPGLIDPVEGTALRITNIPGLDGVRLGPVLAERLGMTVVLENDVNAMAYGEFLYGAGAPCRNLVCLTLGTGVGGGLVLEGRLFRGSGFTAGEIGHVCVDPDGIRCPCGSHGCLERYVGEQAIVDQARWRLEAGIPSTIPDHLETGGRITGRAVAKAAEAGDRMARGILADAGRRLGLVLGGLMNVLAPDAFVVGGGVAGAGDLILEPARHEARLRVFADLRERLLVLPAALGNQAGIVGCASLAREAAG